MKARLDKLLVDRGIVPSRERAQRLILAGQVLVDEQKVDKAGAQVAADCAIRLLGQDLKYVSRGGLKLERALGHWKIDLAGKLCLDVGSSTGGFTDCMLQHGAARVIAIDTGYGQMDFKLRQVFHPCPSFLFSGAFSVSPKSLPRCQLFVCSGVPKKRK